MCSLPRRFGCSDLIGHQWSRTLRQDRARTRPPSVPASWRDIGSPSPAGSRGRSESPRPPWCRRSESHRAVRPVTLSGLVVGAGDQDLSAVLLQERQHLWPIVAGVAFGILNFLHQDEICGDVSPHPGGDLWVVVGGRATLDEHRIRMWESLDPQTDRDAIGLRTFRTRRPCWSRRPPSWRSEGDGIDGSGDHVVADALARFPRLPEWKRARPGPLPRAAAPKPRSGPHR